MKGEIEISGYKCPKCGKYLKFLMNDYFCECGYSDEEDIDEIIDDLLEELNM